MLRINATFDSTSDMVHVAIIKSLGGAKAVSEDMARLGIPVAPVTVRSWSLNGRMIPAKYWAHIAAISKDKQVNVSFEALAQAAAA